MKLRIYRNSLRFRLSPADVERLDKTGNISEKSEFSQANVFSYILRTHPNIDSMRALLDPCTICVEMPQALVHDWSRSETVSLRHSQTVSNGKTLDILIEKDFECLEGQSDDFGAALYQNPNKTCLSEAKP